MAYQGLFVVSQAHCAYAASAKTPRPHRLANPRDEPDSSPLINPFQQLAAALSGEPSAVTPGQRQLTPLSIFGLGSRPAIERPTVKAHTIERSLVFHQQQAQAKNDTLCEREPTTPRPAGMTE